MLWTGFESLPRHARVSRLVEFRESDCWGRVDTDPCSGRHIFLPSSSGIWGGKVRVVLKH